MEEADIMEMITGSEFAKKIKELALKNNKSIKKVLKDCGINRNYIYDLENKIKYPAWEKITVIAEYFKVSADDIQGIDNKIPSDESIEDNSELNNKLTKNEKELLELVNLISDEKLKTKFIEQIKPIIEEYALNKQKDELDKGINEILKIDTEYGEIAAKGQSVKNLKSNKIDENIDNID